MIIIPGTRNLVVCIELFPVLLHLILFLYAVSKIAVWHSAEKIYHYFGGKQRKITVDETDKPRANGERAVACFVTFGVSNKQVMDRLNLL